VTKTTVPAGVNEIQLRGRISSVPNQRVLPSGDRLVSVRVVVPRPPNPARPTVTLDTFDCVAWTARAGDALLRLVPQDQVEISGALRRRFWRGESGTMSRVEVEVSRARRLPRQP